MSLLYLWRARPRDASERTRVIDAATEPSAKRERGRKPTQNCRPRRHPIYPARRHSHATDIIVPVEISACRACSSSSRVPRVVNALSPRKPRQINRAMFRQLLFSNCANTNLPQSKQRRGERRLVEGRDHWSNHFPILLINFEVESFFNFLATFDKDLECFFFLFKQTLILIFQAKT